MFARVLLILICLDAGVLWAEGAPPQEDGPNGHRLVIIPAGEYPVGTEGFEPNPFRTVSLGAYAIATTETTNAQFAAFVLATSYVTDAEKRGNGKVSLEGMADWAWKTTKEANWRQPFGPDGEMAADHPDDPVTQISGADAEAYTKWVGGRLPTNEEWEVAARAGSVSLFPWGDRFDVGRANVWNGASHRKNHGEDGYTYLSPVKSFPPNAWGLYDVVGNVFEYCQGLPAGIFTRKGQEDRLLSGRGGSWWCSEGTCAAYNLRDIGTMDKHGSLANQGFRIVFGRAK